jgi:hypothetical protein
MGSGGILKGAVLMALLSCTSSAQAQIGRDSVGARLSSAIGILVDDCLAGAEGPGNGRLTTRSTPTLRRSEIYRRQVAELENVLTARLPPRTAHPGY